MPLALALWWHASLGLLLAWLAAPALRASPRAAHALGAFRALALHELVLGLPSALWLLTRAPDWTLSYLLDAGRLPSGALAAAAALAPATGLAGFYLGAWLVRDHRAAWLPRALAGFALAALALGWLGRERLGVVGTLVQHRAGFGLRPLAASALWPALPLAALLAALGAAQLAALVARPERAR